MTDSKKIYNSSELKEIRRDLRRCGTKAEAIMWKILKNRQICGLRFRRQFSVGPYILDFYCPEIRLAIELDGQQHFSEEGAKHDFIRDKYLNKQNITVVRLENMAVTKLQTAMIDYITDCANRLKNNLPLDL